MRSGLSVGSLGCPRVPAPGDADGLTTFHFNDAGLDMIRIVLVEPRALVGLGIRGALDREPDMEVVAEVRSADDALAVAEDRAPDVFVLDVELQEPSTSAATHRLAQEAPTSGIVVVGREDDDASILEAVEIGAMGHVPAIAEPGELMAVIRKVADGEDPLRDELIGAARSHRQGHGGLP